MLIFIKINKIFMYMNVFHDIKNSQKLWQNNTCKCATYSLIILYFLKQPDGLEVLRELRVEDHTTKPKASVDIYKHQVMFINITTSLQQLGRRAVMFININMLVCDVYKR